MTNKDIDDSKNVIDEHIKIVKMKEENDALKKELDKYINLLLPRATRQADEMIRKGCWDLVTIVTNDERSEMIDLAFENEELRQKIKDFEDVCDGSCFSTEPDERDEKIKKMQERIDDDCVRINRYKVTINTLVDMYSVLRNQAGMD